MIVLQLPAFPKGQYFGRILDGRSNFGQSLGLGWPGRGWQSYSSLGVLEGMSSEAEFCSFCILCCFSL